MNRHDLGEIITAMVTPFDKDLEIDYNAAENLAKYLKENSSDAILVAGTTGESPTLTHEEESELLLCVKSAVGTSCKIIMGAGSNCTKTAVSSSIKAQEAGAEAILSVVPYYNKPNQKGLVEHFSAVAKSVDIPIILYNIPGRTGINMLPETVAFLANEFKNIVAVKQSFPDMDIVTEIRTKCPEDFMIYSGDDSLTLPMMSLGAHGVVSVASHIAGKDIKSMIHNFKSGQINAAKNMHLKLYPLFKKIFMAPNPIPIKQALTKAGLIQNHVRQPLCTLSDNEKLELYEVLNQYL